jgi:lipoyl(octanoyl) transferase
MRTPSRPPKLGPDLWVCHLGSVRYTTGLELQRAVRARRQTGSIPDTLLLLEHPPVYTVGRRADPAELPLARSFYRAQEIDIVDADRGGRITYHGPGQLVGYPIMRVSDIGLHLRTIESAIVDALAGEGVQAHARPHDGPDYTGVWVGPRKIASIGVHVQRGVSSHGFAVNVVNDLEPFSWIVPCGLAQVSMTSVAHERGAGFDGGLRCLRRRVAACFCSAHGRRQRLVGPRALGVQALLDDDAGARVAPARPATGAGVGA